MHTFKAAAVETKDDIVIREVQRVESLIFDVEHAVNNAALFIWPIEEIVGRDEVSQRVRGKRTNSVLKICLYIKSCRLNALKEITASFVDRLRLEDF